MRALLDVNVLIALLDQAHPHHETALSWLKANIKHGWASCPITQNGCIRIMSQASYPGARSRGWRAEAARRRARQLRHAAAGETRRERIGASQALLGPEYF